MKKCHPEKVFEPWARQAITEVKHRTELFTHYITTKHHATGNLAPGCDFRDLLAWYEIYMPLELAAITRK